MAGEPVVSWCISGTDGGSVHSMDSLLSSESRMRSGAAGLTEAATTDNRQE